MNLDPQLLAWAQRHHGLVTLERWRAHGGARPTFYRLCDSGFLVRLAPGVAALVGTPIGPMQWIEAGVLGFGPGVVVSDSSATWLWGGDLCGDEPVDLMVVGRRRRTTNPRYALHRPRDAAHVRHVRRAGLPVTTPTRTLIDLGATRPDAVAAALETFQRRGHVTVPMVHAALTRWRRRGRPGVAPLADALSALRTITDSELESVMRALFESAGMSGWIFHDVVEGYEVDFVFHAERVIVEVDGWDTHGARRRNWEQDREKDLLLFALGWSVVRLTWNMVVRRRTEAIARLRAGLGRRASAPTGPAPSHR